MKEEKIIRVDHAKLKYKNFSGRETRFNPPGSRNFCVILEDEKLIKDLREDGWNIKEDEYDGVIEYYVPVQINFMYYQPPRVQRICGESKVFLDDSNISILDGDSIIDCTVIIRSRYWDDDRKIKAYLKSMKAIVEEDIFDE